MPIGLHDGMYVYQLFNRPLQLYNGITRVFFNKPVWYSRITDLSDCVVELAGCSIDLSGYIRTYIAGFIFISLLLEVHS